MKKTENKNHIGLIVAIEMEAIFHFYSSYREMPYPEGFRLLFIEKDDCELYVLQTGMGEIAAAAGTQYLITACQVSTVINFGVVGGLTPQMSKQKVCLVENVVHYKYDCSEFMDLTVGQVPGHGSIHIKTDETLLQLAKGEDPSLKCVTCCSGDKFVSTAEEKEYLAMNFHGDICDMESAGIILTCECNQVPCILFKAVSDGLQDGAEGFYSELFHASLKSLEIADRIIEKF